MREVQTSTFVQTAEAIEKYLSPLGTYYDFMNSGKIGTKESFLTKIQEPSILKDENNNPIIPREIKAKKDLEAYKLTGFKNNAEIETVAGTKLKPREAEAKFHAEKHDETKDMNKTDFGSLLIDSDYTDPFKLLKGVFALNNDGTIPKYLVEDEIKKEETTEEVQNG